MHSEKRAVRVGIIGCGSMGSDLARNCASLEKAEIVGACDIEAKKAEQLAEELDADCFASSRELLSEDVEAVIVAVPNFLHAEVSVEAAKAGKHVFCEKPMALSVAECDEMIEAAKGSGVGLMIGQSERYDPVFDRVKQIVDSGIIGRPFSIHVERLDGRDWVRGGASWRGKAEACGGMLYHCNVHELDYMRYICEDVDRVGALMSKNVAEGTDYEDTTHVLLHFRNGCIGTFFGGHCSALPRIGGKIHCTKGTIDFARREGLTYKLFDGNEVGISAEDIEAEPATRREMREFTESVIEGKRPTIPGEEGRKVIEIIAAAYLSAKEGRQVDLAG